MPLFESLRPSAWLIAVVPPNIGVPVFYFLNKPNCSAPNHEITCYYFLVHAFKFSQSGLQQV